VYGLVDIRGWSDKYQAWIRIWYNSEYRLGCTYGCLISSGLYRALLRALPITFICCISRLHLELGQTMLIERTHVNLIFGPVVHGDALDLGDVRPHLPVDAGACPARHMSNGSHTPSGNTPYMHRKMPRLCEAHRGERALQSAHRLFAVSELTSCSSCRCSRGVRHVRCPPQMHTHPISLAGLCHFGCKDVRLTRNIK
jgi:hypothetical protein